VVDLGAFRQLVLTYRKKLVPATNERALDERNWATLNQHFGVIVDVRNNVAHPTDSNCPTVEAAASAIESAMAVLAMLGLDTVALGNHLSELETVKPTPRLGPSRRFGLPSLGPIFGRSSELAQLQEMLAPGHSRLVTITGQGGVGKTRLAIAAAEAVAQSYGHVRFIDLVGAKTWVEGRRLLAQAISPRFESRRAPGVDLSSEPMLIVLDNFEHLVRDGATELAAMARRTEGRTFLVTSIKRLGLRPERILKLAGLERPRTDDSAGDLAANPAIGLFISRVASGRGHYRPSKGDLADIAEICRRVEGLPLAVTIAAGHAVDRPPGLVLRNLRRFLASRVQADGPDRHQTVDACLDLSWQLLSKDERAVWRRSSYLLIGGSSETICEVCSFRGLSKTRVEIGIAGLVRHSVIELNDQHYRLPELVRQYGMDKVRGYEVRRVVTTMILWATNLVQKLGHADDPADSATRDEALTQAATALAILHSPEFPPIDIALRFLVAVARASSDPDKAFGQWGKLLINRFQIYQTKLRYANSRTAAEAAVELARLRTAQSADSEAEAAAVFAVRQTVRHGYDDLVLGATAVFMTACGRRTTPRKRLLGLLARPPRSRASMLAMSHLAFPGYPAQGEDFDWDFAISGLCRVARLWLRKGGVQEATQTLDEVQFAIAVIDLPNRHRVEALKLLELLPDPYKAAAALVAWAEVLLGFDDIATLEQLQPQWPRLANTPRPILIEARKLLVRALNKNLAPQSHEATMLAMVESELGRLEAALDALRIVVREPAPDGNAVMLVARMSALMVARPAEFSESDAIWHRILQWGSNWLRSSGNQMAAFAVDSVAKQERNAHRPPSGPNKNERAMALKSVEGLPLDRVFGYLEAEAGRIVERRSAEERSRLGIKPPDTSVAD